MTGRPCWVAECRPGAAGGLWARPAAAAADQHHGASHVVAATSHVVATAGHVAAAALGDHHSGPLHPLEHLQSHLSHWQHGQRPGCESGTYVNDLAQCHVIQSAVTPCTLGWVKFSEWKNTGCGS